MSLCLVKFFGLLTFHVLHLDYEKNRIMPTRYPKHIKKTPRVYFGVLQGGGGGGGGEKRERNLKNPNIPLVKNYTSHKQESGRNFDGH